MQHSGIGRMPTVANDGVWDTVGSWAYGGGARQSFFGWYFHDVTWPMFRSLPPGPIDESAAFRHVGKAHLKALTWACFRRYMWFCGCGHSIWRGIWD